MRKRTVILILILTALILTFSVIYFYKKSQTPAKEYNPPVENVERPVLYFQQGLPSVVEKKRQAIYAAAVSRDYEKLNEETSASFYYSYGGDYKDGFTGYLKISEKDEHKSAFDIIPTLLRLPFSYKDNLYTWPSIFSIEPSEWSSEDIKIMKTFLTDEQIENYRQYGGYIYYRLGITSSGDWKFYLAGD